MKKYSIKSVIASLITLFPSTVWAAQSNLVFSSPSRIVVGVPKKSFIELMFTTYLLHTALILLVIVLASGFFIKDLEKRKSFFKTLLFSYWSLLNIFAISSLCSMDLELTGIPVAIFAFGLFVIWVLFKKNLQGKWWAVPVWILIVIIPLVLIKAAQGFLCGTSSNF